ncbi:pseudouridine synthase, RluA family [Gaiella occulta]|uniref:Pseudouridine synthase n=1 Tax=Gaiella occulta TaxID=1002870 RepID=A0A7M2YYL1_9ACTN|nr:RluA family pseudouridine synthase [Gaiella occulta]RDI75186.1 pseudouridine synthase, RluA family [Gaiella occulta]
MALLRFHVSDGEAGTRLDRVLAERPEIASRALAERLIASGAALVGGERRPKSHRVEGGDEIAVEVPAATPLVPEAIDVPVVWEDEHLLVVEKPAGIVVHPAGGTRTGTLVHGLLEQGAEGGEDDDRPGIVHRLDKETSGLLVVARSQAAHARLQQMIRERAVERRYLALVHGMPRSRSGRIEAPIGRDRRDRSRHSLDTATPRDAVTRFELREQLGRRALLDVSLETGRTHQIRVHLEAIGLPIAGDPVYGVAGDLGLERQFLHAYRLRFAHPFGAEQVDVCSALPPDLRAALAAARSRPAPG